ncbi:MAG: hypothetical protein ACLURP_13650 [Ruminococcus sp.]
MPMEIFSWELLFELLGGVLQTQSVMFSAAQKKDFLSKTKTGGDEHGRG